MGHRARSCGRWAGRPREYSKGRGREAIYRVSRIEKVVKRRGGLGRKGREGRRYGSLYLPATKRYFTYPVYRVGGSKNLAFKR